MFVIALCSCMAYAQTLHRYVVEVESVPDKREYKVEKLINGNVLLEPQGPKKTVSYYEIISRTPLTLDSGAMPRLYPVGQSPPNT